MYFEPLYVDKAAPELSRIVPEGTMLEAIVEGCIFTEGPVWDKSEGALYYTDIRADQILKWVPGRGNQVVMHPAGHPDGLTLDEQGRIVVAGWGARTVWRWEPDGGTTVLASRYQGKKLNSPNDIILKSDGSIYWTDPNGGMFNVDMGDADLQKYLEYQGVYRLSADGSEMTLLGDDYENPNGICFSPDESVLYVNDTRRRHIRAFDVQPDGSVSNGRLFAETVGPEEGNPDGLRVDVLGNVYCTGPAGVHVFSPDGSLLGRLHCPKSVANMTWGDADWRTMYMTARETVYRVRLGVTGVPHGPHYRLEALAQGA